MTHRFKIGQGVRLEPSKLTNGGTAEYKIIRLIPDGGSGPQYRIKAAHESYERMALERDLTGSASAFG